MNFLFNLKFYTHNQSFFWGGGIILEHYLVIHWFSKEFVPYILSPTPSSSFKNLQKKN